MDRRHFLHWLSCTAGVALLPLPVWAASTRRHDRLLVLVALKGGNDGLNTVIPYQDPAYYALRPRLALPKDNVIALGGGVGLHPALEGLLPAWRSDELAVLQGVGYPAPNLSHFRSIEIWETASRSDQTLQEGWLSRAFRAVPVPAAFSADGAIIGGSELGPLAGSGARAIVLSDPDRFVQQAQRLGKEGEMSPPGRNPALAHVLKVEIDVAEAGRKMGQQSSYPFRSEFPKSGFGETVRTAAQLAAAGGIAALHLTLGGFDTHQNQLATHANLLRQLADGLAAFRGAMQEINRWDQCLVLTYGEFGRRPRENQSGGTDHGTASVHFALGGQVRGGFYGAAPDLAALDGNGNLAHAIDFRSIYATVLERWWQQDAASILGGRFPTLPLLRG